MTGDIIYLAIKKLYLPEIPIDTHEPSTSLLEQTTSEKQDKHNDHPG